MVNHQRHLDLLLLVDYVGDHQVLNKQELVDLLVV